MCDCIEFRNGAKNKKDWLCSKQEAGVQVCVDAIKIGGKVSNLPVAIQMQMHYCPSADFSLCNNINVKPPKPPAMPSPPSSPPFPGYPPSFPASPSPPPIPPVKPPMPIAPPFSPTAMVIPCVDIFSVKKCTRKQSKGKCYKKKVKAKCSLTCGQTCVNEPIVLGR